jgi:hypothetical protein
MAIRNSPSEEFLAQCKHQLRIIALQLIHRKPGDAFKRGVVRAEIVFCLWNRRQAQTRRLPMSATLKRKEGQNRLLSQMPNEKILPLSKHTPFNWKINTTKATQESTKQSLNSKTSMRTLMLSVQLSLLNQG